MPFRFKFAVPRRAKRILQSYAKKDRQPDIDPVAVELMREHSRKLRPKQRPKHFVIHLSGTHRFDLTKTVQTHFHVWCVGYRQTFSMGCHLWMDFDDWQDYLVHSFRVEYWDDGTWFREDFLDKLARGALPKLRPRSKQRAEVDYWEVPTNFLSEQFNPYPLLYYDKSRSRFRNKKPVLFWETQKWPPKKTVLTPDWQYVPRAVALDPSRTDHSRKEVMPKPALAIQARHESNKRRLRKELGLPQRQPPASTFRDPGTKKYWHDRLKEQYKLVLKPLPEGQKRPPGRPPKSAYMLASEVRVDPAADQTPEED